MRLEVAEVISDAAADIGLEVELRESYSGRGMFGESTAALTCGRFSEVVQAVAIAFMNGMFREEGVELDPDGYDFRWSQDSMGLGIVVY